jgi:hypothetical protein
VSEDNAFPHTPPAPAARPPIDEKPRGRRDNPVVGYGPAAAFAEDLRALRGRPPHKITYDKMARTAALKGARSTSESTLANAASGHRLPTPQAVRAYVLGCGHDAAVEVWLTKLEETRRAAQRYLPDLSACRTRADLRAALLRLVREHLSGGALPAAAALLAERLRQADGETIDTKWTVTALPADRIVAELAGRVALTPDVVANAVFACGGLVDAIDHWRGRWDKVDASPPPPPPAPPPARPTSRDLTRRQLIAGGAGLLVAGGLVGGGAVLASRVLRRQPSAPLVAPPPSAAVPPVLHPAKAAAELLKLGARVRALGEPPFIGRFTYTHLQAWSLETTQPRGRQPETFQEEHLWWADDLSGVRELRSTVDGKPRGRTKETYRPGEVPIVIPHPSDDPDELARQLAGEYPAELGAAGALRAVAALYACHVLSSAQRAAVLTVLARVYGIQYDGVRPGRTASQLAVSAATGGSAARRDRDVLLFDTGTGALTTHEMKVVSDRDGAAIGEETSQMLFLERRRTDRAG